MTQLRSNPFVRVTWLKQLLVGDHSCEWATWFKAHHTGHLKPPNDFDAISWKIKHVTLLRKIREKLEAQGYDTRIEAQNDFKLPGNSGAVLAGKPDLIAVSDGKGIIVDAKTGKPNASDITQVMIYMWAVPLALPRYKGVNFDGLVVYKDREVSIPNVGINEDFKDGFFQLVRKVTGNTPAAKIPSTNECQFCDITEADCPERLNKKDEGDEPCGATPAF